MILIILKRLGNMPYLAITLKTFLVICLFLSASIFFLLKVNYAKTLLFNSETIQIKRNQFGVPYVKTQSFISAMYGWGYVTAEDRLFQMSFKRLVGKGKLSKYLGRKALNIDKMFRQLNFQYWADKTVQKLKKQNTTEYKNLQSFVNGINDHVQSLTFLPIEFYLIGLEWQKWTLSDLFLHTKVLVWSQSMNMADEYIRSSLLKNYTIDEVNELMPFGSKWNGQGFIPIVSDDQIKQQLLKWTYQLQVPKFNPAKIDDLKDIGLMKYLEYERGSNSWVIHGNHTKSGQPLLANDPHLSNSIPLQWHQVRIEYLHKGKTVFIQGSAMTGIPSLIGISSYAAIGLTTIHADTQDLFKQKINGNYYELEGRQIELKQRRQIIEIENEQSIEYLVQQTHRGPIISFISHWGKLYQIKESQKISLAWIGFNDEYITWTSNSHWAELDTIQDLKYFMKYETYGGPNMNALYATKDNHIGYSTIGTMPMRRNNNAGNFIKDGTTTEHDWIGLIRQQQSLSVHDPVKGYIVTANNRPVSEKYQNGAYQSSMYTARANRIDMMIRQKIQKNMKFSVQDMKTMQLDTVDVLCIKNLPQILAAVEESNSYLINFNCDFTKNSFQATIYEVFFYQLYRIINPDKINNFNMMASNAYMLYMNRYIRNHTNQLVKQNMKQAFKQTIVNLTDFFGTSNKEKWVWEKYHIDVIVHRPFSGSDVLKPFYEKRFGGRGNVNTVNVAKMQKITYGDFTTNHRANIRQILTLSPHQKSFWIADTGVSQKFYSKHYDDQFKLYTKDQYIEMSFGQNQKNQENQQY